MIRVWGAVERDGVIICEVRDIARPVTLGEATAEWRWWAAALLEFSGDDPHIAACVPGAPCAKCRATARRWWWEWARQNPEKVPGGPQQVALFGG